MGAIFQITDGTSTIDLLDIKTGYSQKGWRQAIAQYKGGGTWTESSLSDGRRIVNRQYGNMRQEISLTINAADQDAFARAFQDLMRLLEKAADYWITDWQNEPVYIISKADCETNTRYAYVYTGTVPDLENIYPDTSTRTLFITDQVMESLALILEHTFWQADVPGSSTCVQLSATQAAELEIHDRIVNPDFETAGAAPPVFQGYNDVLVGGGTVNADAVVFQSGAQSCRIDRGGANGTHTYQDISVTAGDVCQWTFYARGDGVFDGRYRVYDVTNAADIVAITATGQIAAAWAQITVNFTVPTGCATIRIYYYDPSGGVLGTQTWFDNADLKITSAVTFGRSATCLEEVYVTNKHNEANLTHMFYSDGGVFSANQIGSATPYLLLPAVPAIGDIAYFCVETAGAAPGATDDGPFSNIIADIASGTGSGYFGQWEYWNGAWVALSVTDQTDALKTTGVNGVFWEQPADWVTTTINSVQGFWVRFRVLNITVPVGPQQQNRDVYTALWNNAESAASEIGGDIPALARYLLNNVADTTGTFNAELDEIILSLRSVSRGTNFRSILYASDIQLPDNIGCTIGVGPVAFTTDVQSPAWRNVTFGGLGTFCSWGFNTGAIALEYFGLYRAFFLVGINAGTASQWKMRLDILSQAGYTLFSTPEVSPDGTADWTKIDLGIVQIPPSKYDRNLDSYSDLSLSAECTAVPGGGNTISLYGLVLIPIDEFAIQALNPDSSGTTGSLASLGGTQVLDLDSVKSQRNNTRTQVKDTSDNLYFDWRKIANSNVLIWQHNTQQGLYFLGGRYNANGTQYLPYLAATLRGERTTRYFAMRGDR